MGWRLVAWWRRAAAFVSVHTNILGTALRRLALALLSLTATGCASIAEMLGFVPVDSIDGGPPASVLGLEEALGISGGASVIAAIGLNLYRNWTRSKRIQAEFQRREHGDFNQPSGSP